MITWYGGWRRVSVEGTAFGRVAVWVVTTSSSNTISDSSASLIVCLRDGHCRWGAVDTYNISCASAASLATQPAAAGRGARKRDGRDQPGDRAQAAPAGPRRAQKGEAGPAPGPGQPGGRPAGPEGGLGKPH